VRKNNESESRARCNIRVGVKNIDHGFHQPAAGSAIYGKGPHIKSTAPMARMPTRPERSSLSTSGVIVLSPGTSAIDRSRKHFRIVAPFD
jgi:hypothetical protein